MNEPNDEPTLEPTIEPREPYINVVTYGGGVQSTAIAALIVQGRLPRPERIVMADTGRERSAVWKYLDEITNPALAEVGLRVERIDPRKYTRWGLSKGQAPNEQGEAVGDLLIPAYTEGGKLPTFCSNEWKQRPVRRYLRELGYGPDNPIRMWFGMSLDEVGRMRKSDVQWIENWYPFILNLETKMYRQGCVDVVRAMGWPDPIKSACWMCPHRDDATWRELKAEDSDDFQRAVQLEREIRDGGKWGDVWLHKTRVPLDEAKFDSEKSLPLLDLCADACWT